MDKYCGCRVADILDIAPCPPSSLTYNEFRNYALSQNISDAEIKRIASNCQISGYPTPRPPPFPVEYLEEESYVKILIIVVVVVAVVLIAAVVVIFIWWRRRNHSKRDTCAVARKRPYIVCVRLLTYDCCENYEDEVSSARSMTDINQKTQNGPCKIKSNGTDETKPDNQIIGTDKIKQDNLNPITDIAANDKLIVGKDEKKDEKPSHANDKSESDKHFDGNNEIHTRTDVPETSENLHKLRCKEHTSEVIQSEDSSKSMKAETETLATQF